LFSCANGNFDTLKLSVSLAFLIPADVLSRVPKTAQQLWELQDM
jgi:hypothetical protein